MVQKYRLLHEHIANQRRDFIHKESRRIAKVQTLDAKGTSSPTCPQTEQVRVVGA